MKIILAVIVVVCLSAASYLYGVTSSTTIIDAPPAEWAADNPAALSWQHYLVSLEAAAARIMSESESQREQLDGIRYLAQLSSAAQEMKVAKGHPARPAFTDWMSDYRKFLGDSPDATYLTAEISSDYRYEITGNKRDAVYLGVMLYGKSLNGWNRAAANASVATMRFDTKGNFRLLLSERKPDNYAGDWLQLDDDIHLVMVRQYFHDRQHSEVAELSIRNLDEAAPIEETSESLASRLDSATHFLNATLAGNIALMKMLQKAPNSFEAPKEYNQEFGGVFYPTLDNTYYGTWFSINHDEVLVIEGKAPDVAYWSISIQNRWMQSLDYDAYPETTLNNKDISLDDQGYYRVVLSKQPVEGVNWLGTAGFNRGLLSIRYQLAGESEAPSLTILQRKDL